MGESHKTTPPQEPPIHPDALRQWRQAHFDLTEAMRRVLQFQKDISELRKAVDLDTSLDLMESFIAQIVEFAFARLYLRNEAGQLVKVREFCPEHVAVDDSLIEWGAKNGEVALVPIELNEAGLSLRSLVLLPFTGNISNLGLLLLWLPQDTSAFTQEQEAMFGMLARETAGTLETLQFHASLEKARGTLHDIVESVPHGLMAIDANDFILLINGTMEIALGVRRAQAVGAPYTTVLPAPIAKLIKRLTVGGIRDEQEITLAIGGGERRLGFTANPVHMDRGRSDGAYVVVSRDLELTHEVEKLRELDSVKNNFLALVSHELRTPLTSIMAYSEMLHDDPDIDVQTRSEYITIIAEQSRQLSRLVNNVLDITQMEAGKLDYHIDALAPNEFIGTLLMHYEAKFNAKNQRIDLDYQDDPPDIQGDPDRLAQAFNNILDNANKYTPDGGCITIRTRTMPPDDHSGDPMVQFDIEDNGPGISADNLGKMFNKFGVLGDIANHTSGTGLGMAIAKHIVEAGHHGHIWIDSEPGHGTKVHIRIPLHVPADDENNDDNDASLAGY